MEMDSDHVFSGVTVYLVTPLEKDGIYAEDWNAHNGKSKALRLKVESLKRATGKLSWVAIIMVHSADTCEWSWHEGT